MGVDYYLVPKIFDVLNRVTHSRVVIKCQNYEELTLEDLHKNRGIRDFGNDLFWPPSELQLSLLNSPLDQFIEDLEIGGHLDLSLSLALLSSCLEMR